MRRRAKRHAGWTLAANANVRTIACKRSNAKNRRGSARYGVRHVDRIATGELND
jgi:hypothetical protein